MNERRYRFRREYDRMQGSSLATKALVAWIIVFTVAIIVALHQIATTRSFARRQFAQAIYENCASTSALLTKLIKPGIQNTAKLEYYKTHPAEKERALKQIRQALKLASSDRCTKLPSQQFRR